MFSANGTRVKYTKSNNKGSSSNDSSKQRQGIVNRKSSKNKQRSTSDKERNAFQSVNTTTLSNQKPLLHNQRGSGLKKNHGPNLPLSSKKVERVSSLQNRGDLTGASYLIAPGSTRGGASGNIGKGLMRVL